MQHKLFLRYQPFSTHLLSDHLLWFWMTDKLISIMSVVIASTQYKSTLLLCDHSMSCTQGFWIIYQLCKLAILWYNVLIASSLNGHGTQSTLLSVKSLFQVDIILLLQVSSKICVFLIIESNDIITPELHDVFFQLIHLKEVCVRLYPSRFCFVCLYDLL